MVELNMTVAELIEKLENLDPDTLVILSSDSEGNSHSPLADADPSHYIPERFGLVECIHPDDLPDYPEAEPCICLWPTR